MESIQCVCIYLVASEKEISFIKDCIYRFGKNTEIVSVTKFGEEPVRPAKGVSVVLEYDETNPNSQRYASFFEKSDIPFVALCKSAHAGFSAINGNLGEMMVVSKIPITDEEKKMFAFSLINKLKMLPLKAAASERTLKTTYSTSFNKIIAIGSSTGGTEALVEVLKNLRPDCPPILIVQHMPPVFTKLFAERLHKNCPMSVWEAKNGDKLQTGLALIAPGEMHMTLCFENGKYFVECRHGEKVHGCCPSVDILFNSIAKTAADKTVAVILTGMGADGADGMVNLRRRGAFTIGQDKDSSIVYGMPRAAFERGGVIVQRRLTDISRTILENI
ncbi:MAG: chemotaxis protein CheB [Clostridiales bacterium]|jgi:two-component system chemotaxis response regulator CheB|nr:chemotaxis protein CheB [Clostridiales bacterium]